MGLTGVPAWAMLVMRRGDQDDLTAVLFFLFVLSMIGSFLLALSGEVGLGSGIPVDRHLDLCPYCASIEVGLGAVYLGNAVGPGRVLLYSP